jgi:hypothetical protein
VVREQQHGFPGIMEFLFRQFAGLQDNPPNGWEKNPIYIPDASSTRDNWHYDQDTSDTDS